MDSSGYVAVLVIHLHFPEAGSLKAKRKELSSLKALLRGRLGAAVAEVDHHDKWQRATLTVALTARSLAALHPASDRLEAVVHDRCPQGVRIDRVVASVDELRP